MKKTLFICSTLGLIATMVACHKTPSTPTGTVYLDLPATPATYFTMGFSNDTSFNQKATLGRVLFYDGHLSLNNAISCASCHKQELAFSDNVAFSTGYEAKLTQRNSKPIANVTGFSPFNTQFESFAISSQNMDLFWDGRENILGNLADRPITNHVEMGMDDPDKIPAKLASISAYTPLFQQAYGDNNITSARISECLAVFMASIRTGNSKFEMKIMGVASFNAQEARGFDLFTGKYDCNSCHHISSGGYLVEQSESKDIGLDSKYTDMGVGAITGYSGQNGTFRVPSLMNVALTAPYMHDGRYKTLGDVIDHYSHNIQPSANLDTALRNTDGTPKQMNITEQDKADLIAFLNTLTDYQMIADPKYANPFKIK